MPRETLDAAIAVIAASQHSCFTRRQVLACGGTRTAIDVRLRSGRWKLLHRGVYGMAGVPPSWERELMAACLAAGDGSMAAGRSAAALWGVPGFDPGPVELLVSRGVRVRRPGIRIRESRDLIARDRVCVRSLPCLGPARLVLDLARRHGMEAAEAAYFELCRRRALSQRVMTTRLRMLDPGGRRMLSPLIALVVSNPQATESVLEDRFLALLRRAGLPEPVAQYRVKVGGRIIARVDFAYPHARVFIEMDGHRYHSTPRHLMADDERQTLLVLDGWRPLRFGWDHVTTQKGWTLETVAKAIGHPWPPARGGPSRGK